MQVFPLLLGRGRTRLRERSHEGRADYDPSIRGQLTRSQSTFRPNLVTQHTGSESWHNLRSHPCGWCGARGAEPSAALPSKVNLPGHSQLSGSCGTNLVTQHPESEGGVNLRSPPCGWRGAEPSAARGQHSVRGPESSAALPSGGAKGRPPCEVSRKPCKSKIHSCLNDSR